MTDHNEAMRLAEFCDGNVLYQPAAALLRKQAERIAELELQPAFAELASNLAVKLAATEAERDTLRAELETERMRLVACGVVAMANTAESAAKTRDMHPDYLCASVRDVAAAVDREMALRAEVERLRVDAERWGKFISLPYKVRAEWAANLSLAPVLTGWVDSIPAIDTARKEAT